MAAAGRHPRRGHDAAGRRQDPRGRHHRGARRGRREVHPLAGRACRPSRATAASRARSARRRTRWSSTASRARTALQPRRHHLDRHRRHLDGWVADGARHVPGRRRSRRSPRSCWRSPRPSLFDAVEQCRPGNRLGDVSHAVQQRVEAEGFVGRPLARRPRHRARDARGPADPELRRARARARCWRRAWSSPIEPMVNAGAPHGPHGRRRLGDLLPGRLAGRPLRVHRRDHRRRPADPHALARGRRRAEPAPREARPRARRFASLVRRARARPCVRSRPRQRSGSLLRPPEPIAGSTSRKGS